jgi:hypothetical protein
MARLAPNTTTCPTISAPTSAPGGDTSPSRSAPMAWSTTMNPRMVTATHPAMRAQANPTPSHASSVATTTSGAQACHVMPMKSNSK